MTVFQKFSFITAVAILASTLSTNIFATQPEWCRAGKPVKFAAATWESAQFYTELARFIVENGYQCNTEVITGSKNVTEAALVSGDLEVWMEQWQGQNVITKKGEEDGKVKLIGDLLQGGTVEGWFVPDYVVNGDPERDIAPIAPELAAITDLKNYKELFTDPENPKKARFLNCPTGWECEKTNSQKIKAYGLSEDFVNFRPGTGGALIAEVSSAVKRGKPVVFYYWSPSALLGMYDFYQLAEPGFNDECWQTLFNTTVDEACGSAYPSTKLVSGVSIDFYNQAPEVIDFLTKLSIPAPTLNSSIAKLSDKQLGVEDIVKQFLSDNQSMWQSWVANNDVARRVANSL